MQVRVILSEHAQIRISERGDDAVSISATVREASSQILSTSVAAGSRRVALASPRLSTIPIVEISPRKKYIGLVVITTLPCSARPNHPIVDADA